MPLVIKTILKRGCTFANASEEPKGQAGINTTLNSRFLQSCFLSFCKKALLNPFLKERGSHQAFLFACWYAGNLAQLFPLRGYGPSFLHTSTGFTVRSPEVLAQNRNTSLSVLAGLMSASVGSCSSKGQTGLFKGFQTMAVSTAPKICAHTQLYSSAAFYSCGRYTTGAAGSSGSFFSTTVTQDSVSRSCMHFQVHHAFLKPSIALGRFFFFFQDPLWCLKTCLQKFLSYDGRSLSWKSESVSHLCHV